MAECEIEGTFDDIQAVVDDIKKLQTYKMFPGDPELYVLRSDVTEVLCKHVAIKEDMPHDHKGLD